MTAEKVFSFIAAWDMIRKGDIVAVGFSGGGDSAAMLHLLASYRKTVPFSLIAVHVHHGIRDGEADRDLEAARELCRKWGIPFDCVRKDVPSLAACWKKGLEETGRLVRQQALSMAVRLFAGSAGGGGRLRIALAHNMNDQAETVILHLARGCDLRGLGGIRPVSEVREKKEHAAEIKMIRPILCLTRQEIEEYLIRERIPFVTDSSNLTDEYARNRIRHKVLPVLTEQVNSMAVSHMANMAARAALAEDYLREKGHAVLVEHSAADSSKGKRLLMESLCQAHEAEQAYAVREALEELAHSSLDFDSGHIRQVLALFGKGSGKKISLPYGILAVRRKEGVCLTKRMADYKIETGISEEAVNRPESFFFPVRIPGETITPLGKLQTVLFAYEGQKIEELKYTKWFDYDKIENDLALRTRQEGDYLILDEAGHRKLLRRYLIDARIPADLRGSIPVIASGSGILWVIGGRIGYRYRIDSGTKTILQISWQAAVSFQEIISGSG